MPSSTARRPTVAGVGELPVLDPAQQRVLGCLMEKQVTVPAGYPLTLTALRSACNQVTSRDPVMDLDERTVVGAAGALRDLGLVRVVWSESGRRTVKYEQTLDQVLGLAADERAVLTVLLLRGAQTSGELRTHGDRLHPFADRERVQGCLRRLADRVDPLVCQLERRAGQQDNRWVHLLGPTAEPDTATAAAGKPAMDLELPIADGVQARDARVRATYGRLAATYADRFDTELDGLPLERWLLDRVVAEVGGRPVIDAGCGPGHVTAYLARAGARARGIDLSPEMIDQARARFPAVDYQVGDLTGLMRPEDADALLPSRPSGCTCWRAAQRVDRRADRPRRRLTAGNSSANRAAARVRTSRGCPGCYGLVERIHRPAAVGACSGQPPSPPTNCRRAARIRSPSRGTRSERGSTQPPAGP